MGLGSILQLLLQTLLVHLGFFLLELSFFSGKHVVLLNNYVYEIFVFLFLGVGKLTVQCCRFTPLLFDCWYQILILCL